MEHRAEPVQEQPEPSFRHLPPRVTPAEMVASQAVSAPDTSVPAELGDDWMIRAGGAG